MGTGIHGGFGATGGSGAAGGSDSDSKKNHRKKTIDDNVDKMKKDYPLTSSGYFGEKGKNVRVIKTDTPESTSTDFYKRLGNGGKSEPLSNGKGTRTILPDGSIIVHRLITSTPGSPAVDIKVIGKSKVRSQKVHFIKEDK